MRMNRRPSRAQVEAALRFWDLMRAEPPPRKENRPAANRAAEHRSKDASKFTPAAGERQRRQR